MYSSNLEFRVSVHVCECVCVGMWAAGCVGGWVGVCMSAYIWVLWERCLNTNSRVIYSKLFP